MFSQIGVRTGPSLKTRVRGLYINIVAGRKRKEVVVNNNKDG